jgi:D-sedoheptulose 7-phosphate isomerase
LRALGHPGDVWLAFSLERDETELLAATEAAREQDLTLIAFTGEAARTLGPQLRDTDVWVPLPGNQPDALFAIGWLALHGLCTAVDTQLLGEDA